jgi:hypothetical protein
MRPDAYKKKRSRLYQANAAKKGEVSDKVGDVLKRRRLVIK